MPVINVLLPLGSTTTAERCGDCPHLRSGNNGYTSKHRRYCQLFQDYVESDNDGVSYVQSDEYETNQRLDVCRRRDAGGTP